MEKSRVLRLGIELYKCLMLAIMVLLLLLILSASRRVVTLGAQWTQENPLPVNVVGKVAVTNYSALRQVDWVFKREVEPLKVEVAW